LWQAANGKVQYAPDRGGFAWTIKQLAGGKEFMMRAQFGLPSVRDGMMFNSLTSKRFNDVTWFIEQDLKKRAPISGKYEIPYFTVSGIQVRYLKVVEKSGYQALPWVQYITQNGDDYRCNILCFTQAHS
jgi:AP-1 complex subunit mu